MIRAKRARLTAVVVAACAFAVSACSPGDDTAADSERVVDVTVAIAPGSEVTIADTTTSADPTTTSTEAPTTTVEPTTTTDKPAKGGKGDGKADGKGGKGDGKADGKGGDEELPVPLRPVPAPATPFVAVGRESGGETARIQQRLLDLGYWNAGTDGTYGLTTTQAVMAFQKYMGLEASGAVDQATADALTTVKKRPKGLSTAGDLIEIDKVRQLLFVIRGGLTELVLNTSTGNGLEYTEEDKNSPGEMITDIALTPNGLFRVDRERPEGWWEGDLGEIYRPKYFIGGIAVHGSNSIPNYPASHGCVRVSVPAMDMIWQFDLMPMWSTVWVHEGVPNL